MRGDELPCKCRRPDDRYAVVDPECLLEMHRAKPVPFYGSDADRVPPGMMFDLGIYLVDDKGVTFECGCWGECDRDGTWEWCPWIDCVVARHPELAGKE